MKLINWFNGSKEILNNSKFIKKIKITNESIILIEFKIKIFIISKNRLNKIIILGIVTGNLFIEFEEFLAPLITIIKIININNNDDGLIK